MKIIGKRSIGYLLIVSAVLGFGITLLGISAVWVYKTPFTRQVVSQVELTSTILDTTSEGLVIAGESLETTSASLAVMETTVQALTQSITDTVPLMDNITVLVGEDLPQMISSTQSSLSAAEASAKVIDSALQVVTSIPFFPGDPYAPEIPLNVALGQVSDSLGSLPDSLSLMSTSLKKSRVNMTIIQQEIQLVSGDVSQIQENLMQAKTVIEEYQETNQQLSGTLKTIQGSVAGWINVAALVVTVVLVWLATTQVGLLTQGLDLLKKE